MRSHTMFVAVLGLLSCGQPGNCQEDGGSCGSANYQVRVASTQVPADGYSKVPVFTIGTLANGAASTEPVLLTVSPSSAGTISPAAFNVAQLGSTSYFTPCASNSPACSGTFELRLALASAPSTVVATSGPLTLVAPTGVGNPAPCLGSANVVFFDGDQGEFIFPHLATITQGTWSGSGSTSTVRVQVTPSNSSQGAHWDLVFSTEHLGIPLGVNVYPMAERAAFASPGHPGMEVGRRPQLQQDQRFVPGSFHHLGRLDSDRFRRHV